MGTLLRGGPFSGKAINNSKEGINRRVTGKGQVLRKLRDGVLLLIVRNRVLTYLGLVTTQGPSSIRVEGWILYFKLLISTKV